MSVEQRHPPGRWRAIAAILVAVTVVGLAAPAVSFAGSTPGGPAPTDPGEHDCAGGSKWVCDP